MNELTTLAGDLQRLTCKLKPEPGLDGRACAVSGGQRTLEEGSCLRLIDLCITQLQAGEYYRRRRKKKDLGIVAGEEDVCAGDNPLVLRAKRKHLNNEKDLYLKSKARIRL